MGCCGFCGAVFQPRATGGKPQRFCSVSCRQKAARMRAAVLAGPLERWTGELEPWEPDGPDDF